MHKPFTLRTDETFDSGISAASTKQGLQGIHRGLKIVDEFLKPFTREGMEKLLENINCGTYQDEVMSASQSTLA